MHRNIGHFKVLLQRRQERIEKEEVSFDLSYKKAIRDLISNGFFNVFFIIYCLV